MNKILLFTIPVLLVFCQCKTNTGNGIIMTVNGPISSEKLGTWLTHEHILVDFIGADSISNERWERPEVIEKAFPYLQQIKDLGCQTFVECTPDFLGRDPILLKSLSDSTGLNIITNTGLYGARNNKFIPGYAFEETAEQLAKRWTTEWEEGIDGTGIKPGFIKIGVDNGNLSEMHKKLISAAAIAHLKTGLVIASHTGSAIPAFEQIEILKQLGVSPEAFIWVHAQSEKEVMNHIKAAQSGAWISLDGLGENNLQDYLKMINNLKDNNLLNKVLLSHDAGWYDPAKENSGEYRGYTTLFEKLVPLLRSGNYSEKEINQLLVINPAQAFTIKIRKANQK
ncbi:MAG: phosphotriesterase [Prolixibacteraceae bacterium]|nr:phosphotriesterase [Prolixibacteraceae bacterium]